MLENRSVNIYSVQKTRFRVKPGPGRKLKSK